MQKQYSLEETVAVAYLTGDREAMDSILLQPSQGQSSQSRQKLLVTKVERRAGVLVQSAKEGGAAVDGDGAVGS